MFRTMKNNYENSYKEREDKRRYMETVHQGLMDIKDLGCFLEKSVVDSVSISKNGMCLKLNDEYNGVKFAVNDIDYEEVPISLMCMGEYEKEETEMVCKILSEYKKDEDFTAFDVGGNIGWYTLNIKKRFGWKNVYTFEPGLETFNRLKSNVELNGYKADKLFNIGFYKEAGSLEFYYDAKGSGASSLVNLRERESVKKISVDMIKMDDFVRGHNILRLDFIKCDVEGSELFVYEGGKETIRKYRPIVFSEMLRKWAAKFNYHPNDIIIFFEGIGYECFTIKNGALSRFSRVDENTIDTNYFFLHKEKHCQIIKKYLEL